MGGSAAILSCVAATKLENARIMRSVDDLTREQAKIAAHVYVAMADDSEPTKQGMSVTVTPRKLFIGYCVMLLPLLTGMSASSSMLSDNEFVATALVLTIAPLSAGIFAHSVVWLLLASWFEGLLDRYLLYAKGSGVEPTDETVDGSRIYSCRDAGTH